jgi:hypothetical protein
MEEAPENGKELSQSSHAIGMDELRLSMPTALISGRSKKLFQKLKILQGELVITVNMGWCNHFLDGTGMNCIVTNGHRASADVEKVT